MVKAKCPSCSTLINLGHKPWIDQRITCPECDTFLEIIKINPPILDWVFIDEENIVDSEYLYDENFFERHC